MDTIIQVDISLECISIHFSGLLGLVLRLEICIVSKKYNDSKRKDCLKDNTYVFHIFYELNVLKTFAIIILYQRQNTNPSFKCLISCKTASVSCNQMR